MSINGPDDITGCRFAIEPHKDGALELSGDVITKCVNQAAAGADHDFVTALNSGLKWGVGESINGTEVIRAKNEGGIAQGSAANNAPYAGPVTFIVVTQNTGLGTGSGQRMTIPWTAGTAMTMQTQTSTNLNIMAGVNPIATGHGLQWGTTPEIVAFILDGASSQCFKWAINADSLGTREDGSVVDCGTAGWQRTVVGSTNSGGLRWDGLIGCWYGYDKALSTTELDDLAEYIGTQYGIGGTTPPPTPTGGGHTSDARFNTLRSWGYTGATPEMLVQWYQDNGATSDDQSTAFAQFLAAQGFTPGHVSDQWFAYLGSLGYQGALPDREFYFWGGGKMPTWTDPCGIIVNPQMADEASEGFPSPWVAQYGTTEMVGTEQPDESWEWSFDTTSSRSVLYLTINQAKYPSLVQDQVYEFAIDCYWQGPGAHNNVGQLFNYQNATNVGGLALDNNIAVGQTRRLKLRFKVTDTSSFRIDVRIGAGCTGAVTDRVTFTKPTICPVDAADVGVYSHSFATMDLGAFRGGLTRASSATGIDASGVIYEVADDEPRFHDGVGWLIEDSSTQATCMASNPTEGVAGSTFRTFVYNATGQYYADKSPDAAPDGTLRAARVELHGATDRTTWRQFSVNGVFADDGPYMLSWYGKSLSGDVMRVTEPASGNLGEVRLDPADVIDNGWHRFFSETAENGLTLLNPFVANANGAQGGQWKGLNDNAITFDIWGVQAEEKDYTSSFIFNDTETLIVRSREDVSTPLSNMLLPTVASALAGQIVFSLPAGIKWDSGAAFGRLLNIHGGGATGYYIMLLKIESGTQDLIRVEVKAESAIGSKSVQAILPYGTIDQGVVDMRFMKADSGPTSMVAMVLGPNGTINRQGTNNADMFNAFETPLDTCRLGSRSDNDNHSAGIIVHSLRLEADNSDFVEDDLKAWDGPYGAYPA